MFEIRLLAGAARKYPLRRKSPSDGRRLSVWGQARCVHPATGFRDEMPIQYALGHRAPVPVGFALKDHRLKACATSLSGSVLLCLPSPQCWDLLTVYMSYV